ncbi:MAG: hypothetical protein QOI25_3086 [Mycobacterium sp.]|jgi:hypothetical protein|nr:hypothetical protein [Mycobacterium sp.]
MSNRIHPPEWPSPRGPWPEVDSIDRLYDHGWPWCASAAAHPDNHDGYPDQERHVPWHECHGRELFIDGTRRDLDGEPVGVSVYIAAPFRFGQPRDERLPATARVVLETWTSDDDSSHRVSLTPGQALQLARILVGCADNVTFTDRVA